MPPLDPSASAHVTVEVRCQERSHGPLWPILGNLLTLGLYQPDYQTACTVVILHDGHYWDEVPSAANVDDANALAERMVATAADLSLHDFERRYGLRPWKSVRRFE